MHFAGQFLADLPGRLRRQRPRIDRVEVPPRRQHVGHAARRRAARPGRNVTAVERVQQIADFVRRVHAAQAPARHTKSNVPASAQSQRERQRKRAGTEARRSISRTMRVGIETRAR